MAIAAVTTAMRRGLEALERTEREIKRDERRKERREKFRRAMDRLAVLAGTLGGYFFGTRKIGWVIAAVLAAIGAAIIWKVTR